MPITISSKEFNQKASAVLKMSAEQPVFITKWGKVVSVLSSYEDYQQHKSPEPTFEQLFANNKTVQVDDDFFAEFEQSLSDIRHSNQLRDVDFD